MVSKGWTRPQPVILRENRHQSKIYTESNQSPLSQIFGDLTSMQTLAIYPRLLVRGLVAYSIATRPHKRRLGSRDVFSASHGILARAGARAAAQGENTRHGQAAAGGRLAGRVRRHRGGIGHEPVLRAPAGGL